MTVSVPGGDAPEGSIAPPGKILLIGMMGAGKSTVGHRVARRLGWPYLDSDDEVLRRTGRTVPEIWRAKGEAAFRSEESDALAEALAAPGPAVVAVAGGAVLDGGNQARIAAAGLVVWLRATTETLTARVGSGQGRPLLEGDPGGELRRLYEQRRPVYEALADLTVDVDDANPDVVADRVVAAYANHVGGSSAVSAGDCSRSGWNA